MDLAYQPEHTAVPLRRLVPPRDCDRAGWSDAEILELIVGTECARALLARFRSLPGAIGGDAAEINRIADPQSALVIEAVREAAARMARVTTYRRHALCSSNAVRDYLNVVMAWEEREQFRVLFLDKRNMIIADEVMGSGTVDHAPVYPREVVRRALELNAAALILAHNHPTGDPTPSSADVQITRQIVEACGVFKITVHDHVVVGREGHASMVALGLLLR